MEIQMKGISPFCGVTGWKQGKGILSVEKQESPRCVVRQRVGNEHTFHIHILGDANTGHFLTQCQVRHQNSKFRCHHGGEANCPVSITRMCTNQFQDSWTHLTR